MVLVRRWDTGVELLDVPLESLAGAALAGEVLPCADLRAANLERADLCGAELCLSDLRGASLAEAALIGADITLANVAGATFRRASLGDADFSDSLWSKTALSRCTGFARAQGLASVRFVDDSSADVQTLREAIRELPDDLLAHLGLRSAEVEALRRASVRAEG